MGIADRLSSRYTLTHEQQLIARPRGQVPRTAWVIKIRP